MTRPEKAVELFSQGYACSQAVLAAYAPMLNLDPTLASRLAAGFGGGFGRLGEVCGAVSSAVMILGLRYGPSNGADTAMREEVYRKVQEFARQFVEKHQSIQCRDLIECDISTPEGFARARQENLFRTVCPNFVRSAAEILEKMLSAGS